MPLFHESLEPEKASLGGVSRASSAISVYEVGDDWDFSG